MQKYVIQVRETLVRRFDIKARSEDEAYHKAKEMHKNEEIVLDSEDFEGFEVKVIGVHDEDEGLQRFWG